MPQVNEMSWSANGDYLLLSTGEGCVDVVKIGNTGLEKVHSVAAHTSNCFHLKVDRNYQKMLIGGADFQLSIWDLEDLVCAKSIPFE